jgi:U2-associated protein SR140
MQVVEVLTESLTLKETPIPTKVARLMLVSDVLHNSSAPVKNASAYRTGFEAWLPDIMESFNDLYRNITGRITAEALKVCIGLSFMKLKALSELLCSLPTFEFVVHDDS